MLGNNGILWILILLLVFASTGTSGISGDESLILILLAFGFLLIGNTGGVLGNSGCRNVQ